MTEDDLGPRQRAAETKKRRTREKVVAATLDLFEREAGPADGPTLEEISEQSGVSIATLYNHFNTKHDLYLEVLTQLFDPLVRPVRTAIELKAYKSTNLRAEIVSYVCRAAILATKYRHLVAAYVQSYFESRCYKNIGSQISQPIVRGLEAIVTAGLDPLDVWFSGISMGSIGYHLDALLLISCREGMAYDSREAAYETAGAVLSELLASIDDDFKKRSDHTAMLDQVKRLTEVE